MDGREPERGGPATSAAPGEAQSQGGEWRAMVGLAWPVVLAELGWMGMGVVDTLMVAPLGPAAIGAVGLGSTMYFAVAVFGMGLLLGLDTLVAQAWGAGRRDDARRCLVEGLVLAVIATVPITALALLAPALARRGGVHPDVVPMVAAYGRLVAWSTLPLLVYAALRRYLQARGAVRPVMVALVTANAINLLANWALIHGHLGMPALGVAGAAWATNLSRVYLVVVLAVSVLSFDPIARWTARAMGGPPTWRGLVALARLGLPAAVQVTLEVTVFALATMFAGVLGPVPLAAHQIALTACSVWFMVPLGISSAGAVRVGHAVGRGDPAGAARAGWTAIGLAMAVTGIGVSVFLGLPRTVLGAFTPDVEVIRVGVVLLAVAAAFQVCDGLQVVATGTLRGLGDTRTPMFVNLVAHWGIGLPVGWWLGLRGGWGVVGLWAGLALGLIVAGAVLLLTWAIRTAPSHRRELMPVVAAGGVEG